MKRSFCLALMLPFLFVALTDAQEAGKAVVSQSGAVASEQRVALVIGNGEYNSSRLESPPNDARSIEEMLKALGFEVVRKENLSYKGMEDAIRAFGRRIRRGGVGLFYYTGHGAQLNGLNYLIPVGATIQHESEVKYKAVEAGFVLDQMGLAKARVNIVILDACRDNPFPSATRSAKRGLAPISAPSGTFIAYSTAPGKVAEDGQGGNSPYTKALLRNMAEPCLKIEDLFKRVRVAVARVTRERQEPWEASSLRGDFFFNTNPNCNAPAPVLSLAENINPVQAPSALLTDAEMLVRTLDAPGEVRSVALSPDGRIIAALCGNTELILWDAQDGRVLWSRPRPGAFDHEALKVAFSADGKSLASAYDDEVVFWDISTGIVLRAIKTWEVSDQVVFSRDLSLFATKHWKADSFDRRATSRVFLWESSSGKPLFSIANPNRCAGVRECSNAINSVTFSQNDEFLVCSNADHTVTNWKVATAEVISILSLPQDVEELVSALPPSSGNQVMFKPIRESFGEIAVAPGNGSIAVYSKSKITIWRRSDSRFRMLDGPKQTVGSLCFSPNGKLIAASDQAGQINLWSLHSSKTQIIQHGSKVMGRSYTPSQYFLFRQVNLAFSPDGRSLVSGGRDGKVRVWDLSGLYESQR